MSDRLTQGPPNTLERRIVEARRSVFDPERPGNLDDLGLVDGIAVGDIGDVHIRMTLTTPGCPAAPALPREVQTRITAIPGVCGVNVGVVGELGSVTPVTNPNQEEDTI